MPLTIEELSTQIEDLQQKLVGLQEQGSQQDASRKRSQAALHEEAEIGQRTRDLKDPVRSARDRLGMLPAQLPFSRFLQLAGDCVTKVMIDQGVALYARMASRASNHPANQQLQAEARDHKAMLLGLCTLSAAFLTAGQAAQQGLGLQAIMEAFSTYLAKSETEQAGTKSALDSDKFTDWATPQLALQEMALKAAAAAEPKQANPRGGQGNGPQQHRPQFSGQPPAKKGKHGGGWGQQYGSPFPAQPPPPQLYNYAPQHLGGPYNKPLGK